MRTDLALILSLLGLSCLALIAACFLGSTSIGASDLFSALLGQGEPAYQIVVWEIRLPRALAAYAVGAALGLSGAALQGLLRNPLAEPGVLGVSACSALGATLAIYYGAIALGPFILPIAAIAGALFATAILALAAMRTGSVITLILIGVGLSSLAGALMSLLMNFAPHPFTLSDMMNWMLGSVANRSIDDLTLAMPFLAIGTGLLLYTGRGLSALSLGEEAASSIGLNLSRQRIAVVTGTGFATGASVSIAGAIGFVGIVAPHVIRPLVNYDPQRLLLPSALFGGLIIVLADIAIRLLPTTNELKLGVMAALIGAPAFIWIAAQRRSHP